MVGKFGFRKLSLNNSKKKLSGKNNNNIDDYDSNKSKIKPIDRPTITCITKTKKNNDDEIIALVGDGKIINISDLEKASSSCVLLPESKSESKSSSGSIVPILRVRTTDSTTTAYGDRRKSHQLYKSSASMSDSTTSSKVRSSRSRDHHSNNNNTNNRRYADGFNTGSSVVSNFSNISGRTTLATSDTVVTTTQQYEDELSSYVNHMLVDQLFTKPTKYMEKMILGITEDEHSEDYENEREKYDDTYDPLVEYQKILMANSSNDNNTNKKDTGSSRKYTGRSSTEKHNETSPNTGTGTGTTSSKKEQEVKTCKRNLLSDLSQKWPKMSSDVSEKNNKNKKKNQDQHDDDDTGGKYCIDDDVSCGSSNSNSNDDDGTDRSCYSCYSDTMSDSDLSNQVGDRILSASSPFSVISSLTSMVVSAVSKSNKSNNVGSTTTSTTINNSKNKNDHDIDISDSSSMLSIYDDDDDNDDDYAYDYDYKDKYCVKSRSKGSIEIAKWTAASKQNEKRHNGSTKNKNHQKGNVNTIPKLKRSTLKEHLLPIKIEPSQSYKRDEKSLDRISARTQSTMPNKNNKTQQLLFPSHVNDDNGDDDKGILIPESRDVSEISEPDTNDISNNTTTKVCISNNSLRSQYVE